MAYVNTLYIIIYWTLGYTLLALLLVCPCLLQNKKILNRRATEKVSNLLEKTHLYGSYPFSGSSGASDLQLYHHDIAVGARNSSRQCWVPQHNNSWPYQRGYISFLYLKGHCNRFIHSSFLKASLHERPIATPIYGCFHPSFGLLGPWRSWYECG